MSSDTKASDILTTGSERIANAVQFRRDAQDLYEDGSYVYPFARDAIASDPGVKALVEAVQWAITDIAKGEQAVAYLRAALRKWEHGDA